MHLLLLLDYPHVMGNITHIASDEVLEVYDRKWVPTMYNKNVLTLLQCSHVKQT